jgi:hypothetical protein
MKKNVELSRALAQHKRVRAVPKMCYWNASRVVLRVPGYEAAAYVEGVAANRYGLIIEHGWVEHGGEVIDPTLPDSDYTYFPGLRFVGRNELRGAIRDIPRDASHTSGVPLFMRFGWSGMDSRSFCQAWDDAWDHVYAAGLIGGERPRSLVSLWEERRAGEQCTMHP